MERLWAMGCVDPLRFGPSGCCSMLSWRVKTQRFRSPRVETTSEVTGFQGQLIGPLLPA